MHSLMLTSNDTESNEHFLSNDVKVKATICNFYGIMKWNYENHVRNVKLKKK